MQILQLSFRPYSDGRVSHWNDSHSPAPKRMEKRSQQRKQDRKTHSRTRLRKVWQWSNVLSHDVDKVCRRRSNCLLRMHQVRTPIQWEHVKPKLERGLSDTPSLFEVAVWVIKVKMSNIFDCDNESVRDRRLGKQSKQTVMRRIRYSLPIRESVQ
jgi:hypothetical protein